MTRRGELRAVFAIPILLAICSLAGLVSALTGDGWRDIVAWVGLALPMVVVVRAVWHRHA